MDRKLLHQIVKESIASKLFKRDFNYEKYEQDPALQEPVATFVTLQKDGQLRGCIGSLIATRSLLHDLVSNAQAAAFNDPRFMPLDAKEYEQIFIEVSLLTQPKELQYSDSKDLKQKIEPFKDGVILQLGSAKATFLPSVWEQLPTFELFFSHLCQKAQLGSECLHKHPQIFTYEAIKY